MKKQKNKTKTKSNLVNADWKAGSEEAFHVANALLHHQQGLATIAHELFPELTSKKESAGIGRVKSLIKFAVQNSLLEARAPEAPKEVTEGLKSIKEFKEINFHLVEDRRNMNPSTRLAAICTKAADVVARKIDKLLAEKTEGRIVVANAGGPTISECVRHLEGRVTVSEEANRLCFISLNNAGIPTDYGYSANVLAVRLAQIYGGRHIALPSILPKDLQANYNDALENVDLLICGAGTRHGVLFSWLRQHLSIELPETVVGDMCLIPLDKDGNEVRLSPAGRDFVDSNLRPAPSWGRLMYLNGHYKDKVLCVFGTPQIPESSGPEESKKHDQLKVEVARAILKGPLAKECVMGASLADKLTK